MTTIKDVAQLAGVSPSTVSRALSGKVNVDPKTKKRVLQAVRELDYHPNMLAQGLKEGKSKTIGLIIPNIRDLIFPAAVRGITDVAKKHGYTVVLVNTDEDVEAERQFTDNLKRRLLDGFIFSTASPSNTHVCQLREEGYPVVLLIRHLGEDIDAVIVDNFKGGYEATEFLIHRGYRRIALINGTLDLDLYRQRFEGYRAALERYGLPFDPELVVHDNKGWEDGFQAVKTIWNRGKRPDAVFGVSDPKAVGAIKALREMGLKIPRDVAVIGYDNLDVAELVDPPLTTMEQPFYEAGRKAAERLIKLITSKRKLRPVVERLEARLLVRESVGYGEAVRQSPA